MPTDLYECYKFSRCSRHNINKLPRISYESSGRCEPAWLKIAGLCTREDSGRGPRGKVGNTNILRAFITLNELQTPVYYAHCVQLDTDAGRPKGHYYLRQVNGVNGRDSVFLRCVPVRPSVSVRSTDGRYNNLQQRVFTVC